MTKIEIACVIIGFILCFFSEGISIKNYDDKSTVKLYLIHFLKIFLYVLMILLPLYFNYWRR